MRQKDESVDYDATIEKRLQELLLEDTKSNANDSFGLDRDGARNAADGSKMLSSEGGGGHEKYVPRHKAEGAGKRLKSKRKGIRFKPVACLLTLLFIVFLILAWGIKHYIYPPVSDETVEVSIDYGDSIDVIANDLKRAGIIKSSLLFKFFVNRDGKDQEIVAGSYALNKNMRYWDLIEVITTKPPEPERVIVPEGYTVEQIEETLSSNGIFEKGEFKKASESGEFDIGYIDEGQRDNLEGFLFPKTYTITEDMRAKDLIQRMLEQFIIEVSPLDFESSSRRLGMTPYEIIIIASMIEREAVLDEERSLIAAVIYNRLKANMRLQICATVLYALPEWKDRLTYKDLEIDSPYNTYRYAGLPPAPICNPGIKSIRAALEPANVNYLFYLVVENGRHFFTDDYNEFLRVKERVSAN